jgi:hypothetical protein
LTTLLASRLSRGTHNRTTYALVDSDIWLKLRVNTHGHKLLACGLLTVLGGLCSTAPYCVQCPCSMMYSSRAVLTWKRALKMQK